MATNRDFYSHIEETLIIPVQLLDFQGLPVNLNNTVVEFAVSAESDTSTIYKISSDTDPLKIVTTDMDKAYVEIRFLPTMNDGFTHGTYVYQLRTVSNVTIVGLEGRIFLETSLFD